MVVHLLFLNWPNCYQNNDNDDNNNVNTEQSSSEWPLQSAINWRDSMSGLKIFCVNWIVFWWLLKFWNGKVRQISRVFLWWGCGYYLRFCVLLTLYWSPEIPDNVVQDSVCGVRSREGAWPCWRPTHHAPDDLQVCHRVRGRWRLEWGCFETSRRLQARSAAPGWLLSSLELASLVCQGGPGCLPVVQTQWQGPTWSSHCPDH